MHITVQVSDGLRLRHGVEQLRGGYRDFRSQPVQQHPANLDGAWDSILRYCMV